MHNCISIVGVISVNVCITGLPLYFYSWCYISKCMHNWIAIVSAISVNVCITELLALVLYQ